MDTSLTARLKRLFSSNVVIRRVGKHKLKVIDGDHMQSVGSRTNTGYVDRYTRLHGTRQHTYTTYSPHHNYYSSKLELYTEYETMDMDSIIASALDIYSDETVLKDERGSVLSIKSEDENLQKILENLFFDILNIDFNLWPWVRNLVKYGDFYLILDVQDDIGIVNVTPFSAYEIIREENYDLNNPYAVRFKLMNSGNKILENYEVAHFRLLNDSNFLPYGKSMLEPARKVWKQLTLMEDAMMIHRIMRAPEKRIFKVDIGNIPPNEVDGFMQKIVNQMKKTPFMDDKTGDYNLKFNLMNMLEDYYLPVRGGQSGTEIDTLSGMEFTGIDDIEYLRNRMMAALKVPKSFLGYEEGLCISPDTLIPLLSGEEKTVHQIIHDYENGIKNYVYSIDEETKLIVPGEIEWAGFTRKNAKIVRVHLDNRKYIDCTPDHNFLTRDGKWVEAQDLLEGQPLMPLYTRESTQKNISKYTEVYHPGTNNWEMVHRLVANYYGIKQKGKVIHHKDLNKWNNTPENLDGSMNFFEHRKFHHELAKQGNHSKAMLEYRNSDHIKINASVNGKKGGLISGKKLAQWVKENGPVNKGVRTLDYIKCKNCKTLNYNKQYCNPICWGEFNKGKTYNCKFNNISYDQLIETANYSVSFKDLENKLDITRNTLNRIFDKFELDRYNFVQEYMPLAKNNKGFINNFKGEYANHKVVSIEFLNEQIDTCDITVTKFHNFATSAGVIIHNSGKATLAAEDIRFARTIERIQRIVLSELTKIAIIHLYSQGYEGADLLNFELDMTAPSVIYEQEKIVLYNSKVDLAKNMQDANLMPREWIYKNIFQFSDKDIETISVQMAEDNKQTWRLEKIKSDGEDPMNPPAPVEAPAAGSASTGSAAPGAETSPTATTATESYTRTVNAGNGDYKMPKDGWPGAGRPEEPMKYNSHEHPRGYDPLGSRALKKAYKGGMNYESVNALTKLMPKKKINKGIIKENTSFLDENNLLSEDI